MCSPVPPGALDAGLDAFDQIDAGVVRSTVNQLLDALVGNAENFSGLAHRQLCIEQCRRSTTPSECRLGAGHVFDDPRVAVQLDHPLEFGWELDDDRHVNLARVDLEEVADQIASHGVDRCKAPRLADTQDISGEAGGDLDCPPVAGTCGNHVMGGSRWIFTCGDHVLPHRALTTLRNAGHGLFSSPPRPSRCSASLRMMIRAVPSAICRCRGSGNLNPSHSQISWLPCRTNWAVVPWALARSRICRMRSVFRGKHQSSAC